MSVRSTFYTAGGALRAPWRVLAFLLLLAVCSYLAATLVAPVLSLLARALHLSIAVDGFTGLAAVLGAHVVMLRFVERRPWSFVFLGRESAAASKWTGGFAIGALAIGIPCALLIASGWLARRGAADASWVAAALRVSIYLLPAALLEELATRGYVFAVIRESAGTAWAVGVTSVFFGALHAMNPGATPLSILLVTIAGVFLGVVLLALRSLYAAWMAHFAWNWMLAVVLHALVSGNAFEAPDYRYLDNGPDWATGGPWGPEGGAGAGLGMLGGVAYLYARRRRSAARDLSR